jgi:hypothetical protein
MVSLELFIDINPSDHTMGTGVDSASNRNDRKIILEWIFKKWDVGVRTGLG